MTKKFWLAALLASGVPAVASAVTYDVVSDYGNSAFRYGYGSYDGTNLFFTDFTNTYGGGCFNTAALACRTAGSNQSLPTIAVNTSGGDVSFQTVTLPNSLLLFHPGSGLTGDDAILLFTAPEAGTYSVDGLFQRLDTTTSSGTLPVDDNNGVFVAVYRGSGLTTLSLPAPSASLAGAGIAPGSVSSFSYAGIDLVAGDTIAFAVNNNSNYTFDATGLRATISNTVSDVPEPASWAMMLAGFGLVGGAMRLRSRRVTFA